MSSCFFTSHVFLFKGQLCFVLVIFEPVLSNVLGKANWFVGMSCLKKPGESSLKGFLKQFLNLCPHCWDLRHLTSCAIF